MYKTTYRITWSDLDPNRHVANSAYLNIFTDSRMHFLNSHGFTQDDFNRHNIGPVVFTEEMFYIREVHHDEEVTVGLELLGLSEKKNFGKFAHYLFNSEGKLTTYCIAFFGWINLEKRKLIVPPQQLIDTITELPKADPFEIIPDTVNLKNPKIPMHKTL